ncbi:hypothetical protein [Aurantibacter aestuarii]|uniref:Uncharacterized protein n=1 Tax=Aurantibacter aestuarii TaxID=1266046 RepID=A0A2T1NEM3_9FLAO|nr:hypothetical protein [Aurantibacter aestuarii]PSG90870.1 hypothetical protein C7H52_06245 [Aurantibacter aestuarii]
MKNLSKITLSALLLLCSCKTVKKDWLQENYYTKETVNTNETKQNEAFLNELTKIENSIKKYEASTNQQATTTEKTDETENTTIDGSITAEFGKEKFVQVGNTLIKTNGANVNFQTSNVKTYSKELETKISFFESQLEITRKQTEAIEVKLKALETQNKQFKTVLEQQKNSKSKTTKKSGSPFLTKTLIILIVVFAIYLLLRHYLKNLFL